MTLFQYFAEANQIYPVKVRGNAWFESERGIKNVVGTVLTRTAVEYTIVWSNTVCETFSTSGGMSMQLDVVE